MKKTQKTVGILLALAFLLSFWPPVQAVEGESVQLSMVVSQETVKAGERVSLSIQADKGFFSRGSGLTVYYDDSVLELELADSAAAAPFEIHGPIQVNGKTAFRISFLPGLEEKTISAAEPLAVVQFKALRAAQDTSITMEAAYLYDDQLTEVPLTKAETVHLTVESSNIQTPAEGYAVEMPADITAVAGSVVQIPVTIRHEDETTGYNAFDLTFTYDPDAMKLVSTQISGVTVTEEYGQINVLGYGDERTSGSIPFTLEMELLRTGTMEIQLVEARVDHSGNAVVKNASPATLMDDRTAITAGGYRVILPEGFTGAAIAAPDADYTFAEPADYFDYAITAMVDGVEVPVTNHGDGTYTIPAEFVTGEILVTASRTGKMFSVTLGTDMQGEPTAQYMVDYVATLNRDANALYSVMVTIGGKVYTGYGIYGDSFQIPGGDITGDIVFRVTKTQNTKPTEPSPTEPTKPAPTEPTKPGTTAPTQKPTEPTGSTKPSTGQSSTTKPKTTYAVTFAGSGAGAAQGNATSVAHGKNYTLKLKKEAGYSYQVSYVMGGKASVAVSPNKDGSYTIKNVTGALKITIEKTLDLQISVHEYITLDGETIFMVLVKGSLDSGKIFTYEGKSMYWSDRHQGYLWLVSSLASETDLQQMAEENISTASGSAAGTISLAGDVNLSGQTDLADVQLLQNMYNAQCALHEQGILRFLSADVNGDSKLDIRDAAAVIQIIGR